MTQAPESPDERLFVTEQEADAIRAAISETLPAWFSVEHCPMDDLGQRADCVWIKSIAGPPVGLYGVNRQGDAYSITAMPEQIAGRRGLRDYDLVPATMAAEVAERIAGDLRDTYDLGACLPHQSEPSQGGWRSGVTGQ